jgi:pre-mRNA 3'-end-processing factor FIP1
LRLGLKRGKLLYLFNPDHDVARDLKHRNVITRARFIKTALENAGYTLIPWDFKKGQTPTFWEETRTMEHEEEDDDLYGTSETPAPVAKQEQGDEGSDGEGDQPMDEGLESGEEEESDSESVRVIAMPKSN